MYLSRILYLFLLCLNVNSVYAQRLFAQQPNQNQPGNQSMRPSFDPRNARAMDSFHKLNTVIGKSKTLNSIKPVHILKNKPELKTTELPLRRIQQVPAINNADRGNRSNSTVCYTISGRNFLYQDSLIMWTGESVLTADGNVITSGEYADFGVSPLKSGGFCMKTDFEGNVIWKKLYDSSNLQFDYFNFFKSIELKNGSILMAGRTTNKVSRNDDFILVKLDNSGNIIWNKTYESRFWQGFNGSGDYFVLRDLEEDPATGEIYFVGSHWFGPTAITKVHPSDGHVMWSNAYDGWDSDYPFGIVINANNLFLFQLENGYYNDSYINATAISKTNGDTLYSKHFIQTGDRYAPRLYQPYEVVKQNNGHFLLSGPTTGYFEFPAYTGTKDLFHAGIIELDENLNYVKAYGFKNRVESNSSNTKISLFPDGMGMFTMFDYINGYTGEAHISLFKNEQIYHQRKRLHNNEGIPNEPPSLQLPDGGFLNIKLMGDSTKLAVDGSRIDYYRMHTSDTASLCLGIKDSATSVWYFNFIPVSRRLESIQNNVFGESRVKTLNSWDFATYTDLACKIISHCDTLKLKTNLTKICPGGDVLITTGKNKECGSLVPLVYDTNWVESVTKLNDTTYSFRFNKPGSGYIHASLMGCTLKEDSIHIEVVPERYSLDLGNDTILCPGNSIQLNAGKDFASYKWQDGSTDSTFTVNLPGIYHVTTVNMCGTIFHDTVIVNDHPPIPIDIGPDLNKCNADTLRLTAPPGFISYNWSNNYHISTTSSQIVLVHPLVDTIYYLKAEKSPGCFAFDSVRIKVSHSPVINLGTDKSFCSNDSALLDAGNGFQNYVWSNGNNSQQIIVKNPGQYSVTGTTAAGCKSLDTIKVLNVFSLPSVVLDKNIALCFGIPKTLQAGNYASYKWSTGATTPSISINNVGPYSVTVTDLNGCIGGDSTSVTVIHPTPKNFLPPDTTICSYGNLELKTSQVFDKYQWSTGTTNPAIVISKHGTYWLDATDNNSCKGRDSIIVYPKECMTGFYIPSAFSPNNDGKNDKFQPFLFGKIKSYNFTIYNRWGRIIFQSSDLKQGWDGKINGIPHHTAVFVWTCKYQFEGEPEKIEKGTMTLIR